MNRLSTFLSQNIGIELWVASLIAIALFTIVLNQLAQVLLRNAAKVTARTASVWDAALVETAGRPMLVAIWVIGASVMARVIQREVELAFLPEVMALRDVALIVCGAWFLLRFIVTVGRNIMELRLQRGEVVDRTTVDALGKLVRLIIVVVAILMAAQTLGFQITGLLALGGVGGIAVGFAAKDLLANFFGGLTIYLDRPFAVGDWIRSPDKSLEGTVEYISWRHTRIRAFNKNPIYVPNALFTSIVVENPSRMSHRRISEVIGLRYEDFAVLPAIAEDIRAMLVEHPEIDENQTLIVNMTGFAPSALNVMVYAFAKTTQWVKYQQIKQDVLIRIGHIILKHGAQIAFPTQTLHVENSQLKESDSSPDSAVMPAEGPEHGR